MPLWRTVAVVGVSGSGKTSLAMGTLYAEGMQRFLESLSTYNRRRLAQAQRPDVDRIDHLPPALALRQRPPVPGPRSTVARAHRPRRPGPARHHRRLPGLPRRPLQRRHPGGQDRRPDHSRRARPERARRLERFADRAPVFAALRPVDEVGLGYLRLGEPTPSLSGGESQRLRIASRLRSSQRGALYVFDEPSTGLHPLDVATLAGVFDRLLEAGATIIVIDHDLDLLAAADHLIDMGPGGGPDGGHIVAAGTPQDVVRALDSLTGPWLAEHLGLPRARQPDVLSDRQSR